MKAFDCKATYYMMQLYYYYIYNNIIIIIYYYYCLTADLGRVLCSLNAFLVILIFLVLLIMLSDWKSQRCLIRGKKKE